MPGLWVDARGIQKKACGQWQMTLSKIDFVQYTEMTEQERKNYADGWLYIHNRKLRMGVNR